MAHKVRGQNKLPFKKGLFSGAGQASPYGSFPGGEQVAAKPTLRPQGEGAATEKRDAKGVEVEKKKRPRAKSRPPRKSEAKKVPERPPARTEQGRAGAEGTGKPWRGIGKQKNLSHKKRFFRGELPARCWGLGTVIGQTALKAHEQCRAGGEEKEGVVVQRGRVLGIRQRGGAIKGG